MQSTFYVPEEIEEQTNGKLRENPSLESHTIFAEEALGERHPLVGPQRVKLHDSLWHGLLVHTREYTRIYLIWAFEILWLLFLSMVMTTEMWGSCPFELGLAPACVYCYSLPFVLWSFVLTIVWFLNLYLFVLLVSRGFSITVAKFGRCVKDNKDRGIPKNALLTFWYMNIFLVCVEIAGIAILALSSQCNSVGSAYEGRSRSPMMFWSVVCSVVCVPILYGLGRFKDVNHQLSEYF